MQRETLECAGLLSKHQLMVAGVGVDDAAASGRNAVKAAFVDRSRNVRMVPGATTCRASPVARHPELARGEESCTLVTTIGIIVQGFEMQEASAPFQPS